MSDANNDGHQGADDDARAQSRALFDALDPAMRNLLMEEARRRDAPRPISLNEYDWETNQPSSSHGNYEASNSRGNDGSHGRYDDAFDDDLFNFGEYDDPSTSRGSSQQTRARESDAPSTSRGFAQQTRARESDAPSTSRGFAQQSRSREYDAPSTSRGFAQQSRSREYDAPSTSRGFAQQSRAREYDAPSTSRGFAQQQSARDQFSRSRGNFQSSSSLFQPDQGTNTVPGNINPERRTGFSSSSSAPRSSTTDFTPGLSFSIASRNQYVPVEAHDIYDRAMGPYDAEGMQKLQCASPLAKVKKIVFRDGHFMATLDDNTCPKIASASFGEFLTVARGDVCFTAESETHNLQPYCIDGWIGFLEGVNSINALGQLDPPLIRSIIPNLGGATDALGVTPADPMEMDIQEMCGLIPAAATFITLDAAKFTHGDTVNAVENLVNSRRDKEQMARLLLMTDRFPMPTRLGTLLQMPSPGYPIPMFANVQFQYPPQPMESAEMYQNQNVQPRDRVLSFDNVSSIVIESSAAPQSTNATDSSAAPQSSDTTDTSAAPDSSNAADTSAAPDSSNAADTSAAPQSSNALHNGADEQQQSSSGNASSVSSTHDNDTANAPENIYCREDGPLARHENENISRRLPPLIQLHASGTQPWVTTIVIEETRINVSFDTSESITIPCDSTNLGRLMGECQAAPAITLESMAYKKQVFFIGTETLATFFKFSNAVYITGKFAVENLERLVPCLRTRKLNVHRWIVSHAGRLGSITHAGIPTTMDNLYFDTRGTDNVTLVDNLTRVYKDVFEDVHQLRPFLVNFQLVVDGFCALGDALDAQIERIFKMLRDDVPSSAAVLFSIPGDNDIYAELTNQRFLYSHYGPMEALDGTNYFVDYWRKEENTKTLVFGFKSRRSMPRTPEVVNIEGQ